MVVFSSIGWVFRGVLCLAILGVFRFLLLRFINRFWLNLLHVFFDNSLHRDSSKSSWSRLLTFVLEKIHLFLVSEHTVLFTSIVLEVRLGIRVIVLVLSLFVIIVSFVTELKRLVSRNQLHVLICFRILGIIHDVVGIVLSQVFHDLLGNSKRIDTLWLLEVFEIWNEIAPLCL